MKSIYDLTWQIFTRISLFTCSKVKRKNIGSFHDCNVAFTE